MSGKPYAVRCVALIFISCAVAGHTTAQTGRTNYKFAFGPGPVAPGYVEVLPTTVYNPASGYGWEPESSVSCVKRGGKNALRDDFCTSDRPFFFSVALPEGNYNVAVTSGDAQGESITTVKAELRRLMLEKVQTKPVKYLAKDAPCFNPARPDMPEMFRVPASLLVSDVKPSGN